MLTRDINQTPPTRNTRALPIAPAHRRIARSRTPMISAAAHQVIFFVFHEKLREEHDVSPPSNFKADRLCVHSTGQIVC